MSDCKQKFLGLNSIGDLLDAFEKKVDMTIGDSKLFTLQLFKYVKDGDSVDSPDNGIYYDFNNSSIVFPSNNDRSWNTLAYVVSLNENDLSAGSIYTSVRIQQGNSGATDQQPWSRPIKISGINGVNGLNGAEFIFSYTIDGEYSSNVLELLDEDGKREIYYQYRPSDNEEWSSPMIWAKYTTDGQDGITAQQVHYEYCLTSLDDINEDGSLKKPNNNAQWTEIFPSLTSNNPYLWVRIQYTKAGEETIDGSWIGPMLLSSLGQDGVAPEYNITLYKWSEGYSKPDQPTLGEFNEETGKYEFIKLDDFRANNPDWLDVPTLDVTVPVIDVENTVEVSTVEDITDNLVDGKIIKLSEDLQIPTPIIITEGKITIDLNGHTITANEAWIDESDNSTNSYVFWVKGGSLTIQGTGKVIASPADYSMAVWSNGGDVTINGGRFENGGESCSLIYGSAKKVDGAKVGGTIKIYGGEFYATLKGEQAGTGDKRTALNTKNGDEEYCKIVVYGGYFHEFDPSNNLAVPGTNGNFLAEGVKLINNNGVYEVVNSLLPNIWWQCTIKINGAKEEVMQIGTVERYTAIDGAALPGEYTKFMYKWFDAQTLPEDFVFNAEDWNDAPDVNKLETPEASLWMVSAVVNGINSNGNPDIKNWSSPIKLTGPRGPISYDYRLEVLYKTGSATAPVGIEWKTEMPKTQPNYSVSSNNHIWAKPHLMMYQMKYDENGKVVPDDSVDPEKIEIAGTQHYRVTACDGIVGADGKDGSKKNSVVYEKENTTTVINSFYDNNYFISSADETIYNFDLDPNGLDTGEFGATFKFANIKGISKFTCTGKISMPFILKGEEVTEFTCNEYDCFEIVYVLDETKPMLVVIGGKF